MPISPEELAAIRGRLNRFPSAPTAREADAIRDRLVCVDAPALLAELATRTEERDTQKERTDRNALAALALMNERDAARGQIAALTDELKIANERGDGWRKRFNDDTTVIASLKAALRTARGALRTGLGTPDAVAAIDRALAVGEEETPREPEHSTGCTMNALRNAVPSECICGAVSVSDIAEKPESTIIDGYDKTIEPQTGGWNRVRLTCRRCRSSCTTGDGNGDASKHDAIARSLARDFPHRPFCVADIAETPQNETTK